MRGSRFPRAALKTRGFFQQRLNSAASRIISPADNHPAKQSAKSRSPSSPAIVLSTKMAPKGKTTKGDAKKKDDVAGKEKVKGAQSINVRHILVRFLSARQC